jgi:hypothetical protein
MATFSKELLSGSTNGRPIKVAATATAGTTIHTTSSTAGVLDELWIYATNTSVNDEVLTIELGGVSDPDDLIVVGVPGSSDPALVLVVPGVPLTGGVVIAGFASAADVINVVGYVNRITP